MKQYLSTTLALVCVVLVVSLFFLKRGDNAQHETDTGTIADFSNRLDSAQLDIATFKGTLLTLSNRLDESRSESLTFSNRLMAAEAATALAAEQITNLNRHVAEVESDNQVLSRRAMDWTNQMAGFATQIALTESNLVQAGKNYALLENRFRRDVGERLVVERKFNNPSALQAQIRNLKQHPAEAISAESIYSGLDVEVKSNAVHVIAPN